MKIKCQHLGEIIKQKQILNVWKTTTTNKKLKAVFNFHFLMLEHPFSYLTHVNYWLISFYLYLSKGHQYQESKFNSHELNRTNKSFKLWNSSLIYDRMYLWLTCVGSTYSYVHIYLDTDTFFIFSALYATRIELKWKQSRCNWSAEFKL